MADNEILVERAREVDYGDLIDFGDLVFQLRFTEMVPALYRNHPETAKEHYIIRGEGGRIRAMLCSYPQTLHVGERTLRLRGVGTVSVHPRARGLGYMRALMERAVADAREEGCDLMVLGGQRQRYEHFGFTPCGTALRYSLEPFTLRHVKTDPLVRPVPFSARHLDAARALHQRQTVFVERPDFLASVSAEGGTPGALERGGEFIGWYAMDRDAPYVHEFFVTDPALALPAALSMVREQDRTLDFYLTPDQAETAAALASAADGTKVCVQPMCNVLRYAPVIEAFGTLRARREGLAEGTLALEVRDRGERLAVTAQDGRVTARPADGPPDLSLPHLEMMRVLFAPTGVLSLSGPRPPLLRDWLPFPLGISMQDMV